MNNIRFLFLRQKEVEVRPLVDNYFEIFQQVSMPFVFWLIVTKRNKNVIILRSNEFALKSVIIYIYRSLRSGY